MSRHQEVVDGKTYVFGWDQPLLTFYLQVHDPKLPEDENPIVWLNDLYEVDELVQSARRQGLTIPAKMQATLFGEKDEGR